MKFKKYIIEAKNDFKTIVSDIEAEETLGENLNIILNTLKKECSEMCSIVKRNKSFLYRGTNRGGKDFVLDFPRENRRPKDMPEEHHEALDNAFEEVFEWRARSEGVFTTANRGDAGVYGEPYIFFPVNGFEYVWSPDVKDLYVYMKNHGYFSSGPPSENHLQDMYNDLYGKGSDGGEYEYTTGDRRGREQRSEERFTKDEIADKAKKWVDKYILKGNLFRYTYKEKQEMYQKQTEIFLKMTYSRHWKPYSDFNTFVNDYMVEYYDNVHDGVVDEEQIESLIRDKYKDTNIDAALDSRNEVTFKCDKFYLLRANTDYKKKDGNYEYVYNFILNNL